MPADSNIYTPDEMQKISDAVWENPRITPRTSRVDNVPCPRCGASITVLIDTSIGLGAPPFQTSCASCSTQGHGKATDSESRNFTDEELSSFAEALVMGNGEQYCPDCGGYLDFNETEVSGASWRHFSVTCLRCTSRGQVQWPPQDG